MSNEDTIICDMETGICGPVGEDNDNSIIGLIDLTALLTKNNSDSFTDQTEKDK